MQIEVWQGGKPAKRSVRVITAWFWHFRASNGRVVSDAEAFPTKAHALRAAKACVKAVVHPLLGRCLIEFTATERDGKTIVKWV